MFCSILVVEVITILFLNRDENGNVGGELALGGTDPKHYDGSKLEYVGLSSETYWQFKMSG